MSTKCVLSFVDNYSPDVGDDIFTSIFQQYERVIIESLITSFGLDFLVKHQHGEVVFIRFDTILELVSM